MSTKHADYLTKHPDRSNWASMARWLKSTGIDEEMAQCKHNPSLASMETCAFGNPALNTRPTTSTQRPNQGRVFDGTV